MTTHIMKLAKIPFEKIASGQKIIESRLFDEKRKAINVGDLIELVCVDDPTRKVTTKVDALYRYQSFENLFSDFPANHFGGDSKEALLEEIRKYYSIEEERQHGVVGIKLGVEK